MRTTALCLLVLWTLAFAPAPLPRQDRCRTGDDLARLQGDWIRVLYKGHAENPAPTLRIAGNRYHFLPATSTYVITLDTTKRPRRIDVVDANDPSVVYRGVYRIEGDRFTYLIQNNVSDADRPTDFASPSPGAWIAVLERKKP